MAQKNGLKNVPKMHFLLSLNLLLFPRKGLKMLLQLEEVGSKLQFPIKVHRGRRQNFPIFLSCRYNVELGPRQLGLPIADTGADAPAAQHRYKPILVIIFLENIRELSEIIAGTGAKFWLRFCLSALVLVIFQSPTGSENLLINNV